MRLLIFLLSFFLSNSIYAVEILAKDDWSLKLSGSVEPILHFDSTRSFRDQTGNFPVARPGTYNGEEGRSQLSVHTSRFGFLLTPPEVESMKQSVFLAFDFLGYNANPSSIAPTNSETFFYNSSALRMTHFYYTVEKDGWKFLAGQSGSVFGWTPHYYPAQMGLLFVTGINSNRPPQLSIFKTIPTSETNKVQAAFSLSRPAQADAQFPNLDFGLRYLFGDRKAGYTNSTNAINLEQASVALSGTLRKFEIPQTIQSVNSKSYNGGAIAFNLMLPILPAEVKLPRNSLLLLADASTGKGYSETYIGTTFNLPQLPTLAGTKGAGTSLDAGLGGFDTNGNFKLTEMYTWTTQLQYYLPVESKSFVSAGYGFLKLTNPENFVAAPGLVLYDISKTFYANYFYDFNDSIRTGIEYRHVTTEYVDGVSPDNNRFMFTTMYRF